MGGYEVSHVWGVDQRTLCLGMFTHPTWKRGILISWVHKNPMIGVMIMPYCIYMVLYGNHAGLDPNTCEMDGRSIMINPQEPEFG